ncbi:MAG: hypothetical protein P8X79_00815 [Reinekea sp.]
MACALRRYLWSHGFRYRFYLGHYTRLRDHLHNNEKGQPEGWPSF